MEENILYWIWLSERCGIASRDVARLCEKYDDPFDIYRLEDEEIDRIEGISRGLKLKLLDRSLNSAYVILKYCKQGKIDIISYKDRRYPSRLRGIQDPPAVLYVLGKLPDMDNSLCIGVVGTRKMSEYGRDTAYKISYELAAANAVVVSGMALGVDGMAACGALSAGGATVAVLGCGLSVVYPKAHSRLMKEIAKNGAVITEYPPFEQPRNYNFPKRNRIISGLCQGTLVVECSSKSGALITAQRAIDQGREVFALPGKVNESNSEGPNELIKSGALVALSADDIISHYDFLYHDCINYKAYRKAKDGGSTSVDKAMEKYGIADIYSRGRTYRPTAGQATDNAAPEQMTDNAVTEAVDKPNKAEKSVTRDTQLSTEKERMSAKERASDRSAELLAALDDDIRRVFEALPMDRAVSADSLPIEGMGIGDIVTALTMLEISGLAESLPGGMYIRK